jgi:hypothetical protein
MVEGAGEVPSRGVGLSGSRWEPAPRTAAPGAVGTPAEQAESPTPEGMRHPSLRSRPRRTPRRSFRAAVVAVLLVVVGLGGGLVVGRETSPAGVAPIGDGDGPGEPGRDDDDRDHDRDGVPQDSRSDEGAREAPGQDS